MATTYGMEWSPYGMVITRHASCPAAAHLLCALGVSCRPASGRRGLSHPILIQQDLRCGLGGPLTLRLQGKTTR